MMREVRESASYSIPRAKGELAVQLTVASGNRVFGNPVPREGEARTKRRPSSAQLYGLGGACDLHKRINDRSRLGGPNQACEIFARLEKDQRRPELHAIRASERTSRTVFDLDVRHRRETLEGSRDVRQRPLAMTATGSAELQHEWASCGVDLFPSGLRCCKG